MASNLFVNIRVYWLAFIVYWGIILFGYDTGIAGGIVSQKYFQEHFGYLGNKKKTNDVTANIVSVLQAGAFFGALGSAPVSERIGRKATLIAFSSIFAVGAILTTVADKPSNGLDLIYAGRVVSGLGIGAISAVAPAFVSECSPKEVRGRITGLFQIMVATGVMISYFINYGISLHHKTGKIIWQLPFGLQLVPCAIMLFGLPTVKESPRWLASKGRTAEGLANLAYLRRTSTTDHATLAEFAEIEAAIKEEREARTGLGMKEAFLGKGNFIRFVIAFVIFLLQQWGGQNTVGYYAPQIFASIGYSGSSNSLLASGIYGVLKVVATALFIFFGVETLGRKLSLIISALGMGSLFFVIGAILKTHPPPRTSTTDTTPISPNSASQAMAGMLYIYVCFYSLGWGPLPWVYVSDIFPTRTRHYGLSLASATQWLFNFMVSRFGPDMISDLGYKIFFMFGTINIVGMGIFSAIIPETKGRSLEDMDVIFGAVSKEKREADIAAQARELDHEVGVDQGSSHGSQSDKEKA